MRTGSAAAGAMALALCLAGNSEAQLSAGTLPLAGTVADSLVSRKDPQQSYALFLPSRYQQQARWPLLVVMDPRGRATRALRMLQPAAERYGYVIISSYNTRSDELFDPNAAAVNAMLADADRLLSIDSHRIYLVGFSGTARAAWEYGYALYGQVAGVLGFGAGFPPGWQPPAKPAPGTRAPFVFFGGAGATDFNHEEMEQLGPRLDSMTVPHRIVFYPGPHSWPPAPFMDDAVTWMELAAQRRGLAPEAGRWVDSLLRTRLDSATAADSSGQSLEAYRRYRAIGEDFEGLRNVGTAERRSEELARSKAVRRGLADDRERLERYHARINTLREVLADLRASRHPPKATRLIGRLSIRRLQQESGDQARPEHALAAARMLEEIFAVSSFYEPRDAMNAGAPDRALVLLELAEFIHPGRPDVCRSRLDALAKQGRIDTTSSSDCDRVTH